MHAFVRQLLASCVQPHASRARTSIRSAALAPAPRRDTTAVSLPLIIAQRCSLLCSLWLRARLPGERATLPLQKRRRGAPEVCLDGPMAAEEQPVHWNLKPLHRTHGICRGTACPLEPQTSEPASAPQTCTASVVPRQTHVQDRRPRLRSQRRDASLHSQRSICSSSFRLFRRCSRASLEQRRDDEGNHELAAHSAA